MRAMRTATLRLGGAIAALEFRIIAFDQGGVSVWAIADGRAIGRNIDFAASEDANLEEAIRSAATILALWNPDMSSELLIDS